MANTSTILPTDFKAFSGANIFATIGNQLVGSLQAVTVSITREVAALYSFADANPKAFVKGKRGIAGTLVFTQFDRHALLQGVFKDFLSKNGTLSQLGGQNTVFKSNFSAVNAGNSILSSPGVPTSSFESSADFNQDVATIFAGGGNNTLLSQIQAIYALVGGQQLRYSDQIPAFDLTLNMVNETGDASFCVIGGMVLCNEGWGYTLDDLTSEVAFTYVARYISPLQSIHSSTGSLSSTIG